MQLSLCSKHVWVKHFMNMLLTFCILQLKIIYNMISQYLYMCWLSFYSQVILIINSVWFLSKNPSTSFLYTVKLYQCSTLYNLSCAVKCAMCCAQQQRIIFDWLKYVYALVKRKLHKLDNIALLIVGFNGYSPSLQLCYWRDGHPGVANTFWTAVYAFSLLHTIDCCHVINIIMCELEFN